MKSQIFTLTDALVVLGIVAGIGAISYFNFGFSQIKARDAQRIVDVKYIAEALEQYFRDYGEYPASHLGKIVGCGAPGFVDACEWGTGKFGEPEDQTIYLNRVPVDPIGERRSYLYVVNPEKKLYQIFAALEGGRNPYVVTGIVRECGKTACNFGVANQWKDVRDRIED